MDQGSLNRDTLIVRALGVFVGGFILYFVVTQWTGLLRLGDWLVRGIAATPDALRYIGTYYQTTPFSQLSASLALGAVLGAAASLGIALRARLNARAALVGSLIGTFGGLFGSQLLSYPLRHCTYANTAQPFEVIAGFVLTALGALLICLTYWSLRLRRPSLSTSGYFRSRWVPYALLAPTLLGLALFLYYPSIQTVMLSLFAGRNSLPNRPFTCLRNYVTLTTDIPYQNSFVTTVLITLLIVSFSLAIGLAIAVLASQKVRGANIYRALLIWPFALSPIVTGAVFLAMFREEGNGLINGLLGLSARWLRDATLARLLVVFASVWNILGFNILFYIAGLQNVPKDLHEAAAIDGANLGQRFRRITLPMLAPYTFFLLVTNVTYSFYGIYGVIDALTKGGPPLGPAGAYGQGTSVLIYKLYTDAFAPAGSTGLASAQALILFVLVAGLTLLQFRYIESQITYGDRG